jgi:hypothetical protein
MNKDERWRRVLGQPERDVNLRDVELLLRSFAMLISAGKYKPSMARFLNVFSSEAKKNFSEEDVMLCKNIFENFLDRTSAVDPNSYKLSDRFSVGVFEAAMYASAKTAWNDRDADLVKPLSNDQIQNLSNVLRPYFQGGTSRTENVTSRLIAASGAI